MRAVVQRVSWARVEVDGALVGAIGRGLLVYLGIGLDDAEEDADYVLRKVLGLRVFEGERGKMDLGVRDVGGALLVVSQFTLYGDVRRGRRPSFDRAKPPEQAEPLYDGFIRKARAEVAVATGQFRASMQVSSCNDGPVTLIVDSKNGF